METYVERDESDEDSKIRKGDLYKFKITLNDLSLKEGETRGYIHTRNYPWPKYCHWWMYILDEQEKIIACRHITSNDKVYEEVIDMQAQHRGMMLVQVILRPDCYIDLDIEKNYTFEVHAKDPKVKDEFFVHPEDMEAAKTKNLFQELLQGDAPDSDDEDEEEEEPVKNKEEQVVAESEEESDEDAPALMPVDVEDEIDFAE